jgi:HEAT repeat protein
MQTENVNIGSKRSPGDKAVSDDELQGVAKVVNALLMAYRNYTIYPEGHATSRKSIENLLSAFNDFFPAFDDLRLHVEKERLLYSDTVVHQAEPDSATDDITFQLYRDGIQWIEFQDGLDLKELALLFSILNKYRSLAEETEGDIVTDLIDEDFSHISFEAIDIFWQEEPLIDFSNLNKDVSGQAEAESHDDLVDAQLPESAKRQEEPKSIADPSLNDSLWELTPDEKELLRNMVLKEENWDKTEDVFNVLMVILRSQEDEQSFAAVLDFTMEEVIENLELGKFSSVLKLFQSLHQLLYRDIKEENDWVKSQIESFFDNLSKPDTFNSIAAMLQKLDGRNTEQINVLRQVLLYFSPETILMLGPVMLQNRSHEVQKMIQGIIEYLCLKDLNPLEQLLDHPDEAMGERLLAILERLQGERAQKIFYAMLDHSSDKVRTLAIRVLISKEPHNIKRLFPFIKDPYEPIQKEIFKWLSCQKSEQLENLLIGYMKKNLHHSDPDHILTCYKALGHCGSATSVPFLRRILLKNGWNSFTGFGKLTHRRGAGCALALLDTWEAKDILLEASNSKFPVVRQAFHESMAIINEPGDQSNE